LRGKVALMLFTSFTEFQRGVLNLMHAFILAKVESGRDGEVLKEVKEAAGVQHATPTMVNTICMLMLPLRPRRNLTGLFLIRFAELTV